MLSGNDPVAILISELSKLPGIGENRNPVGLPRAQSGAPQVEALANALVNAKSRIRFCASCVSRSQKTKPATFAATNPAKGSLRLHRGKPSDQLAIEMSSSYRGRYHVLHGLLSPLDGIGPNSSTSKSSWCASKRAPYKKLFWHSAPASKEMRRGCT